MKLRTALELGRVSNLPTVWSNALAGVVLAGGPVEPAPFALLALAVSLAYVGGMYLNDAFDFRFDAAHRPDRPIPAGRTSVTAVFAWGFGLLAASVAVLAAVGRVAGSPNLWAPPLSGLALVAAIVLYDAWHKRNPVAPALMGLCRALVLVTAAVVVAPAPDGAVVLGAIAQLAWVAGLTFAARSEHLLRVDGSWPLVLLAVPLLATAPALLEGKGLWVYWVAVVFWGARCVGLLVGPGRAIGKAVVGLIAGIALVDALLVAWAGAAALAPGAVACFAATLVLQRVVSGT